MANVASPNKPIYSVGGKNWNKPRLCATPSEAAKSVIRQLSAKEKKAVDLDILTSLVKSLRVGHDHYIFGVRVERKTLFG